MAAGSESGVDARRARHRGEMIRAHRFMPAGYLRRLYRVPAFG
jgi:hypothetical protein